MLHAPGVVDAVALAQRIQAGGENGILAARQRQRIDDPLGLQRRVAEAAQLGVEEADVERGVVRDDPASP